MLRRQVAGNFVKTANLLTKARGLVVGGARKAKSAPKLAPKPASFDARMQQRMQAARGRLAAPAKPAVPAPVRPAAPAPAGSFSQRMAQRQQAAKQRMAARPVAAAPRPVAPAPATRLLMPARRPGMKVASCRRQAAKGFAQLA